ncbi:MAG: CoA transferase [Chloroflexi bacterium]|nr:CoA transferase [Chloroflexota bacterium]
MPPLPLAGVRILDLTMFMAGPVGTKLLADMGAEVIKVESPGHPDPIRIQARGVYPQGEPGERPWNRSGMINERARNKLGITLDLACPEGKAVFLRLVACSDVVMENYRADVMENLGLGYAALRQANPGIILVSIASQGVVGPEALYRSYGNNLEDLAGMTLLKGYEDEEHPYLVSGAYPDPTSGFLGAGVVVAALRYRRLNGVGMHVDFSQREMATAMVGDLFMDYAMNRRQPPRWGNGHPWMAPHGCYPCQGRDKWVTIAVATDAQWQRLCAAIGRPDLARDERFATGERRWQNRKALDAVLTEWTLQREHVEAMAALQQAGLAAGAVYNVAELFADPHLEHRGFFEVTEDPDAGLHRYQGRPWKLSKTPLGTRTPAPLFGQHNQQVLGGLVGLDEPELQELEVKGVIGTIPQPRIPVEMT